MTTFKQRYRRIPKWIRRTVITLAVIVLLVHIILPPVIKHVINKKLNDLEGYYGYVDDVDISLYRGAYQIQDIHLYSDELGDEFPLFEMTEIDISVQWKAIFKGSLVAEVEFFEPHVYFAVAPPSSVKTKGKENVKSATKDGIGNNFDGIKLTVFKDLLMDQIPLKLNRIEIIDGTVHYIDKSSNPTVDVHLTDIDFRINNISNSFELSDNLISDFTFTSIAMNSAQFNFNGSFDPYDEDITLDMDIELKKLELTKLNKLFLAYAFFDVEKGEFSVFSEIDIEKGELSGYVKPFIDDLDIVNFQNDKQKTLNLFWQGLLGGSSKLIKNWSHDEIASKIPLKGSLNNPDVELLTSIGNIFYHSFLHKFKPMIDNEFNMSPGKRKRIERKEKRKEDKKKK